MTAAYEKAREVIQDYQSKHATRRILPTMPPLDHELGYHFDTLERFLGDRWGEFTVWIGGQTMALDDDGCVVVYWWDVQDFLLGRQPID